MIIKTLKKLIRNAQLRYNGQYLSLDKDLDISCKWYGNDYGGFYVHPEKLNEKSIVYSFGIGEDISFDTDLILKHNCSIHGFDPTPKSISWIKTQNLPNRFSFYPYGIDNITGMKRFFLPKNNNHVSGSAVEVNTINKTDSIEVYMKSFEDIVNDFGHTEIDILKMDIEGSEYEVLPEILKSNVLINQIVIEFHHRMIKNGAVLTSNIIKLLADYGFKLFAYSNSNEELSFINIKQINT